MARALLVLSLIATFLELTCAVSQKFDQALLVHNVKNFEVLFSSMIGSLKQYYDKVELWQIQKVLALKKSVYTFKRATYQLVIMMTASSEQSLKAAEQLELIKYYDEGNRVVFLSHGNPHQNWRVLISLFGFDVTNPALDSPDKTTFRNNNSSDLILIPKEHILHKKLMKDLAKGIVYQGGAVTLTPYENIISWSLLEAPTDALFVSGQQSKQVFDANKMNLIAGSQGQQIKTRGLIVGSISMFSNNLNNISKGDNMRFFDNLIQWTNFETNTLHIRNLTVCQLTAQHCEVPLRMDSKKGLLIKFQIFDEDGEFYAPSEGRVYVQLVKQVAYLTEEPKIVEENGIKAYVYSNKAVPTGIYKLQVIHNKPGYYVDTKENERLITV